MDKLTQSKVACAEEGVPAGKWRGVQTMLKAAGESLRPLSWPQLLAAEA